MTDSSRVSMDELLRTDAAVIAIVDAIHPLPARSQMAALSKAMASVMIMRFRNPQAVARAVPEVLLHMISECQSTIDVACKGEMQ